VCYCVTDPRSLASYVEQDLSKSHSGAARAGTVCKVLFDNFTKISDSLPIRAPKPTDLVPFNRHDGTLQSLVVL